jgi:hypothetical protein
MYARGPQEAIIRVRESGTAQSAQVNAKSAFRMGHPSFFFGAGQSLAFPSLALKESESGWFAEKVTADSSLWSE